MIIMTIIFMFEIQVRLLINHIFNEIPYLDFQRLVEPVALLDLKKSLFIYLLSS